MAIWVNAIAHYITNIMRFLLCGLVAFFIFFTPPAWAESLTDRISNYPNWHTQPDTQSRFEEINYPSWIAGTWHCKSTLIEMIAPLKDNNLTTPGFEGNRQYLNQPVTFDVKFGPSTLKPTVTFGFPTLNVTQTFQEKVVVDRIFNGLSIGNAYLGEGAITTVKINPKSPQEQLTTLKSGLKLLSITTGHNSTSPNPDEFITTELFQQIFRGSETPYLNQVETTTKYQHQISNDSINLSPIIADQYTAIYLSPKDPDYFTARNTPVALYRYRLELSPV